METFYKGWVKKKCDLPRLVQKCTFCVQLSCRAFFKYFLKVCNFFLVLQWPQKKSANFFSLKIKSLEKQKCVNKLFLSKSKIFKRLNHRISENWQNCNKKIRNFQFWYNFYGKIIFLRFLRFQVNSVYLILAIHKIYFIYLIYSDERD